MPAPLAIPPSRARRQFAARLAERKRQAEQGGSTDQEEGVDDRKDDEKLRDWTEKFESGPGRFSDLFGGGSDDSSDEEELLMKASAPRKGKTESQEVNETVKVEGSVAKEKGEPRF